MSSWSPYKGEDYLDYPSVLATCHELASAHPSRVSIEVLGQSRRGLDIILLTIGNPDLDPRTAPSIWIDAGTHASEWCGVSAALYTMSSWLERLESGEDPELTAWFEDHLAFVLPCVSPDGYQALFDGAPYLRSSLRPPRNDEPRSGFEPADLDGDGAIRWMRFKHPAGALVPDPESPLFMRPRTLDDAPEDAFFLCSEGRFIHWDGVSWTPAPREFGIDLNRNFPSHWAPFSMFGMDAGAYPASEPESRALLDAFAAREGVCAALTHHTYTGCILTQPYRRDTPLSKGDISVMHALATDLVKDTQYAVYKVFPDFMYDLDKPTVGVWSDTMSTVFGVPAYTVEFWNPYGFAGVSVEKPAAFFVNPDAEIVRAMLAAFAKIPGAITHWEPFDHPQLGPVELGGIDYMRTIRNPPVGLLAGECDKGLVMSDRLRKALPDVRATLQISALADDLYEVRLRLENLGFLSTHGLERAEAIGASPGVHATITTGDGVALLDSSPLCDMGHMAGWASLRTGNAKHMIYATFNDSPHAREARWVVRGEGAIEVTYRAGRAGMQTLTQRVGGVQ